MVHIMRASIICTFISQSIFFRALCYSVSVGKQKHKPELETQYTYGTSSMFGACLTNVVCKNSKIWVHSPQVAVVNFASKPKCVTFSVVSKATTVHCEFPAKK